MMMTSDQSYTFALEIARGFEGKRMRFTYPNGHQRVGRASVVQPPRHPAWKPEAADAEPQVHLDGRYVGGELCGYVMIEVMPETDHGRYRIVWEEQLDSIV